MEYSKTGQFTANQEKLCKEIAIRISKGTYIRPDTSSLGHNKKL